MRGYDAEGSGHDTLFEKRFAQRFPAAIQPADVSSIYRWYGTGSYHLSGFGGLKIGENGGNAEVAAYIQQRADRGEIRQERILLQPHWKTDYRQLVSNHIAAVAEPEAQLAVG